MKDEAGKQRSKISKATPTDQPSQRKSFPIVGIGASAGGLDALIKLLKNLPSDTGMALVVIQHLDPKHESILPELLSRESKMPVSQATDGVPVEQDHVYVIPPNTDMAVYHGELSLMTRAKVRGIYAPIDYFFHSLAKDLGGKAIGVVLSGTGSDGSLGLKEIKAEGGITFAQNPDTAEYADMPRSAVAAGVVDFTLSPAEIAGELIRISQHSHLKGPRAIEAVEFAVEAQGDLLNKIFLLLRSATGVDFKFYKPSTIRRRIARRMAVNKIDTLKDYVEYLQGHPPEVEVLYEDVLINVTEFFRDPEAFDALKREVFPSIIKDKRPDESIRIWVPGCSTGEEAYSTAISLLEFLDDRPNKPAIIIFATDVDEEAVETARTGNYPESILANVSPVRLGRFFTPAERGYQINKSIRDMCVFAKHDITKDPPFSNTDLISFRNVLIYLGSELQKLVIPVLHYALRPGGYLMLGTSETIGGFKELFESVDKKNKVYKRKSTRARLPVEFISQSRYTPETIGISKVSARPSGRGLSPFDILKEANHLASELYAPAGVLIDDTFEILQFRGDTAPYLEHVPGKPSLNALDMAREGLRLGLSMAANDAKRTHAPVTREGLKVKIEGKLRDVSIEVIPIKAPAEELYYLVFFKETPVPAASEAKKPGKEKVVEESRVDQLSRELTATKEYLESVVREKDLSNEELRSAYEEIQLRNEEIQSTNEELQSINEELETSKEELQSTNEELITVNDELQHRNIELTKATDDLSNLFASVDVPIIMLGSDLGIRRFTPGADKVMYVVPSDIGRPISEIKLRVDIPGLERLVLDVIKTLTAKEQEVQDDQGRWYSMQIRPYRTGENRIEGAVIRFVDINVLKRNLEQIKESNKLSEALTAINLAVGSMLDINTIIQCIAVESTKAIGCDAASIEMREDASWVVRYIYGLRPELVGMRFTDEEAKAAALAVKTRKPVIVNADEVDQKLSRKTIETFSVRSLMAVPLIVKDDVIGTAVFIHQSSPRVFTEAQIDFANKLAASVSLALENAQLYEAKREATETLETIIENTNALIAYLDPEMYFIMANDAYVANSGHTREELIGRNHFVLFPNEENEVIFKGVRDTKELIEFKAKPFEYADQPWRGVTYWDWKLVPVTDDSGKVIGLVFSLVDVTETVRSRQLSDALNNINALISSTLDVDEIMHKVIGEATKAIGVETSAILIREEDIWVVLYAYGFSENIVGLRVTDEESPQIAILENTKEPIVINDVYSDKLAEQELIKRYGLRSFLATPLFIRGDLYGIFYFGYHSEPVAFSATQVDFARKLATSISLALENARLYESERYIANTLQSALLTLPEHVEGIKFGHLYRSATEIAQVGGDFYDLFELENGKIGIVLGDVSGKGIEATALTTVVKNTIKAHAYEDCTPALVMSKTNDLVHRVSLPGSFISVIFAILDTATGKLTYCNAGHPPALIKRASGSVEPLTKYSPIIGAFPGMHFRSKKEMLEKGDELILYTDGIIEARCNGGFYGEDRLVAFISNVNPMSAKNIPQAIFSDVVSCAGGKLTDDVAILAISLGGEESA